METATIKVSYSKSMQLERHGVTPAEAVVLATMLSGRGIEDDEEGNAFSFDDVLMNPRFTGSIDRAPRKERARLLQKYGLKKEIGDLIKEVCGGVTAKNMPTTFKEIGLQMEGEMDPIPGPQFPHDELPEAKKAERLSRLTGNESPPEPTPNEAPAGSEPHPGAPSVEEQAPKSRGRRRSED